MEPLILETASFFLQDSRNRIVGHSFEFLPSLPALEIPLRAQAPDSAQMSTIDSREDPLGDAPILLSTATLCCLQFLNTV